MMMNERLFALKMTRNVLICAGTTALVIASFLVAADNPLGFGLVVLTGMCYTGAHQSNSDMRELADLIRPGKQMDQLDGQEWE